MKFWLLCLISLGCLGIGCLAAVKIAARLYSLDIGTGVSQPQVSKHENMDTSQREQ